MRQVIHSSIVLAFLLLLSSCYRGPVVLNPTQVESLGPQTAQPDQQYMINVGDRLEVKFFYNPELNEKVQVRPDGRISLQLVGEILAAGRTPTDINDELKEKYAKELANAQVMVIVRTFHAHKVYVDGEVTKPGVIALLGPMTVMQSIALSQGLKETARQNEVVVVRRAEGKTMVIPVNLESAVNGTDPKQDILLAPYDIVFVPKSNIAMTDKWVDQYITKIVGILPTDFALFYTSFGH